MISDCTITLSDQSYVRAQAMGFRHNLSLDQTLNLVLAIGLSTLEHFGTNTMGGSLITRQEFERILKEARTNDLRTTS
jgi:hypothetical protein